MSLATGTNNSSAHVGSSPQIDTKPEIPSAVARKEGHSHLVQCSSVGKVVAADSGSLSPYVPINIFTSLAQSSQPVSRTHTPSTNAAATPLLPTSAGGALPSSTGGAQTRIVEYESGGAGGVKVFIDIAQPMPLVAPSTLASASLLSHAPSVLDESEPEEEEDTVAEMEGILEGEGGSYTGMVGDGRKKPAGHKREIVSTDQDEIMLAGEGEGRLRGGEKRDQDPDSREDEEGETARGMDEMDGVGNGAKAISKREHQRERVRARMRGRRGRPRSRGRGRAMVAESPKGVGHSHHLEGRALSPIPEAVFTCAPMRSRLSFPLPPSQRYMRMDVARPRPVEYDMVSKIRRQRQSSWGDRHRWPLGSVK